MTDRRYFSGNNLEQAVMKAASHFEIDPEMVDYRQIEKKHGFLRIRRSVVIEVDPDSPRQGLSDEEALRKAQSLSPEAQEAPREQTGRRRSRKQTGKPGRKPARKPEPGIEARQEPRPSSRRRGGSGKRPPRPPKEKAMVSLPAEPRPLKEKYSQAEGKVAEAAAEALEILLDLAGLEMESSIMQGDERLEVELWGPDQERLLKSHGRPLLSIQHLLPRMIRGMVGEPVFCRVDCDHFHDIREERIRDLAQRVASEVASGGRPSLLESMAPDERRIVHLTLSDDPNVVTESEGDGYFKRVKVRPS